MAGIPTRIAHDLESEKDERGRTQLQIRDQGHHRQTTNRETGGEGPRLHIMRETKEDGSRRDVYNTAAEAAYQREHNNIQVLLSFQQVTHFLHDRTGLKPSCPLCG